MNFSPAAKEFCQTRFPELNSPTTIPKQITHMRMNKLPILGLALAASLFLNGCREGDHAGHDHGDHAGHDHDAKPADVAGKQAGTTGAAVAIQVIETPTAEQIAAAKPYALTNCVMSDEALGSMGDPIVVLVGDQQIKLCCEHCLPDLKKDPAKALTKLTP